MTVTREETKVRGHELTEKIKQVIHEGNVRRIILKDSHGNTVLEVPVTVGVAALIVAPVITAVGALAAMAAEWNIQIERTDDETRQAQEAQEAAPVTPPHEHIG
ncbi:DUF4342 domain-containing protein [Nonomuraea sp. ATR24]|uniref:DUF4342 domain-containing protein n=1 Tax=unclassified Nonomuraea TaxID=2593643 RepID=UPI0034062430